MSTRNRRRRVRELEALLASGRDAVREDHRTRLRRAVTWARSVPFYQERLRGLRPEFTEEEFAELPELTRQDLKEHRERLLNPNAPEAPLADATGGSTGQPTVFYRCRSHYEFTGAVDNLTASWVGGGYGRRTLVLWGATIDAPRRYGWRSRVRFAVQGGSWILDCFQTDERLFEQIRRFIERHRPHVVRGYRSVMLEFVDYLTRTRPLRHRPQAVLSAAETLLPEHRQALAEGFGAPVFDRYGSREAGLVASEGPDPHLRVLLPSVRAEVVSDRGINVPGVPGRLLVTSLNNPVMPLLRYAIGDGAVWEGEDPAGGPLPVIRLTVGRSTGMVPLGGGRKVYLIFFHMELRRYEAVQAWQLVQTLESELTLRVRLRAPMSDEVRLDLAGKLEQRLGAGIKLRVEVVKSLEKNRSGKVELYLDRRKGAKGEEEQADRTSGSTY